MASYNFHPKTRLMLNREFLQILTDSTRELSAREVGKQFSQKRKKPTMSSGRASIILRRLCLRNLVWKRFCRFRTPRRGRFMYRLKGRTSNLQPTFSSSSRR